MKKHETNYYEHDDFISFYSNHCNYLNASERFYSNQSQTKKKDFFRKEIFFDQSKMKIKNKEIKIFLEKNNNWLKTILKKTISIQFNERLNERSKKLMKRRRLNESWRKELKKIETSSSRILKKESRINLFYDEILSNFENESSDEENIIEIHSIAAASFNILSRQKDVKIFAVSMKNLKIQLKKQESNTIIDFKSVVSFKYHDFLNVFFKKEANILSSHRKHDHCIKLKKKS